MKVEARGWIGRWGAVGLVALATCALGAGSAVAAPRPARAAKRINALIVGGAASPVLNAVRAGKGRFNVDRAGAPAGAPEAPLGKRNLYKVMIVDGDNTAPGRLQRLPAVRHFADSGRWVLCLDLRRGRFRHAIRKLTGFGGVGHSRVFMFRRTTIEGAPHVQMVAAPRLAPSGTADLASHRRRRLAKRESTRLASFVHETIKSDGENLTESDTERGAGDAGIPPELQHVGWSYTVTGSKQTPDGHWSRSRGYGPPIFKVPPAGSQTATWTMTHNFDVYLDNGRGKPQGNDQIVTYELNGEFTPKQKNESFFQMYSHFGIGLNPDGPNLERAWWTGLIGSKVEPDKQTSEKLIWQASEPQTPNEDTEYTSGNEFEVGFTASSKEGAGFDASYKVSNEETQKIPDWGVENESSGNDLEWLFSSRSGCDVRSGHYDENQCFNIGTGKDGAPNLPPDLSRGQIQIRTSGRWKTKRLLGPGGGELSFEVSTPITLVDTYCDQWNFGNFGCIFRHLAGFGVNFAPKEYSFDAAAVVPIPVETVALTPNPADGAANQEVTGTVKLARPAAMDTDVIIYSDSPNAVVGGPSGRGSQRTISIAKGSTEANFKVQTNDNGLTPGGHTTASITTFYAEPTTTQLRIEDPAE